MGARRVFNRPVDGTKRAVCRGAEGAARSLLIAAACLLLPIVARAQDFSFPAGAAGDNSPDISKLFIIVGDGMSVGSNSPSGYSLRQCGNNQSWTTAPNRNERDFESSLSEALRRN